MASFRTADLLVVRRHDAAAVANGGIHALAV